MGREGTQGEAELRQDALAMEHWVSEVIHIDLQDPNAHTPFLMVVVDGLISLSLKDLRRELSHSFWCSPKVWGRLPSLC